MTSLPPSLVESLSQRFGSRFTRAASIRLQHGRDESSLPPAPPDAVLFAESTDEVAEAVRLCHAYRVPVIPFGAGSSLEGHLLAVRGGVTLDLSRMNRILAIRPEDLDATVEAGVTRKQLNAALHGTGLFFPIDPGADATVGGMAATRASGTNAVRYGTMREAVINATVVLADGRVIKTASRAKKSAAGYDLTRLFVGSEGTLGVITELTLRLHPLPETIAAAVCAFPSIDAAVQTVIAAIQLGVPVARIELLDALSIMAINRHSKTCLREAPTLFFELHGSRASVGEQAGQLREIADTHGGADFAWAERPEARSRLWQARHDAYFACLNLRPGCRSLTTDVCVPISRLAECIAETEADREESGLMAPLLGHVGDGNFHMLLLISPEDEDEMQRAHAFAARLVERALRLEGTCTGEHGIGLGKRKYLLAEHGENTVAVMRAIKRALDPTHIMNPGKILPEAEDS